MRSILFPQFIAESGGERQVVIGDCDRQFAPKSPLIAETGNRSAEERRLFAGMLTMAVEPLDHRAKLITKDIVVARTTKPTQTAEFEETDAAIRAMDGWVEQRRHVGQPFFSSRSISSRICAARS
jgi:hypothetical protein